MAQRVLKIFQQRIFNGILESMIRSGKRKGIHPFICQHVGLKINSTLWMKKNFWLNGINLSIKANNKIKWILKKSLKINLKKKQIKKDRNIILQVSKCQRIITKN
jgi:hypothetical protein